MSSVNSPSQSSKYPLSRSSASWSSHVTISSDLELSASVAIQHQLQPASVELACVVLVVLARVHLAGADEIGGARAIEALHVHEIQVARSRCRRISSDVHPRLAIVLVENTGRAKRQDIVLSGTLFPVGGRVLLDQSPRQHLHLARTFWQPQLHVGMREELAAEARRRDQKRQVRKDRAVHILDLQQHVVLLARKALLKLRNNARFEDDLAGRHAETDAVPVARMPVMA